MVHSHSSAVSQRTRWVSYLLAHEGTYGEISQMSRDQQVSRQTLYSWKGKGRRALEPAQPQMPVAEPVISRERS